MIPNRHPVIIASVLAALASLAGCASAPPKPLRGEFAAIVPTQAAGNGQIGDQVRWGGRIIAVQPTPQETCIELLSRELSSSAKPSGNPDHSQGRFLACRNGFYDPAIFTNERDVTVTGRIVAYETRQIGEYAYRYPRVAADVIYLWPEQSETRAYYADPFWPMHYGAWGWGYPYRTVIVRPAPRSETPPAK
ncbi:MAG: Slp family lipoprotein [Xanthomonadales bacterium]|jgi:outer membrane lipoprotein|nr:Slp family lipoprotein [Xanthomonadales bacterium]